MYCAPAMDIEEEEEVEVLCGEENDGDEGNTIRIGNFLAERGFIDCIGEVIGLCAPCVLCVLCVLYVL